MSMIMVKDVKPRTTAVKSGSEHAPNAIVSMTPLGGTSAQAAHVWTMSNVRALLERSLADPGPWSGVSVRLVEDGAVPAGAVTATLPLNRAPYRRVANMPESGWSIADPAKRCDRLRS